MRVLLGLATGSARIVLLEDAVPTAVFGALAAWARCGRARPLMFRFAYQFIGEDAPKGRDFASRWQYPGFRSAFRLMTVVWGLGYLAEAAAHVVIIETTTAAGTALVASKATAYAVTAALVAWTVTYSFLRQGQGRAARRREARPAAAGPSPRPPSPAPAPAMPPSHWPQHTAPDALDRWPATAASRSVP